MAKTEEPRKQSWTESQKTLREAQQKKYQERINRPSDYEQKVDAIKTQAPDSREADTWASLRSPTISKAAAEFGLSEEVANLRVLQERDAYQGLTARAHRSVQNARINLSEKEILKDTTVPQATRDRLLGQLDEARQDIAREYSKALQSSPEAFMAAHSADLNAYRRQYERGRIVQTLYVKDKINEMVPHLRNTRLCFISGETGTGKTEVARIVAREVTGKPPLVVRGYAGMSSTELFGHMTLTDNWEKRAEAMREQVDQAHAVFKETHPAYKPEDLEEVTKGVLQASSATTTEYILGSVYKAAKEGRVVIIDEANYIPSELLAKLNDVMTKDPAKGEKVDVQEDGVGPITVQEGFGIIFTGNVNPPSGPRAKRYLGRNDFDAAFTDRVPVVDYNRLPQAVDGMPKDYALEDKQVFLLAVVSALLRPERGEFGTLESIESRYSSLFLPGGSNGGLDALWRFSQFASVTQQAFEGGVKDGDAFGFERSGSSSGYTPKLQLSNRGMMRVIEEWRDRGYRYEIDYYIAKDLFNRAQDPNDRAYLYQIGQKFGFFKSAGWEQDPDYSTSSAETFKVNIPMTRGSDDTLRPNPAVKCVIVEPEEVLEAVFGEIPVRTEWPDGVQTEAENSQDRTAEFLQIQLELAELFGDLGAEAEILKETAQFDIDNAEYKEKVLKPRLEAIENLNGNS